MATDLHPHGRVDRRAVGGHRQGDLRAPGSGRRARARDAAARSPTITDGFAVDQLTHSLQTATLRRARRRRRRDGVRVVAARHRQGRERAEPSRDRGRDHQAVRAPRRLQHDPRAPGLPGPALLPPLRRRPRTPATKYEGEPWFDLAAQFADEWDQVAFDPDYDTLPLEHFEPLVRARAARKPNSSSRLTRLGRVRVGGRVAVAVVARRRRAVRATPACSSPHRDRAAGRIGDVPARGNTHRLRVARPCVGGSGGRDRRSRSPSQTGPRRVLGCRPRCPGPRSRPSSPTACTPVTNMGRTPTRPPWHRHAATDAALTHAGAPA